MKARPGRRTSRLEFVVALTLAALFAGWWATRFVEAQADVRILRVREVATTMRMLSRELHLQALLANRAVLSGEMSSSYGPVDMLAGHPAASARGIGQLMAKHASARQMVCAAVQLPDPARSGEPINAFECAPSELEPALRERCAARFMPPLWPGGEPTVTFLFHSARVVGQPCAVD